MLIGDYQKYINNILLCNSINMNNVSIILLNYNWKKFNINCINSVLKQTYKDFEIIFVDNCSIDWSLEEVEKVFKKEISLWKIKIVKNTENTWFDWWNNLWVKHSSKDSKYICLLNNDTTVENNRLEELIKWIESDSKIWSVWSLILNRWKEQQNKDNIYKYWLKPELWLFWEVLLKNKENNKDLIDVTNVSWCSLMYKKELIKRPFEDYYFAYREDNYLWWNLLNMWYTTKLCTKSIVHHYVNWTSKTISDFCLFHDVKNMMINYYMFLSWYNIILLFPLILIKDILQLFSPRYKYPFYILKFKIKWIIRIFKNFKLIKESKNNNHSKYVIDEKTFLSKVSFKLLPLQPWNNWFLNILKDAVIYLINLVYELYWLLILIVNTIINFFITNEQDDKNSKH